MKQFMILGNLTDGKNVLSSSWYAERAETIEQCQKETVAYFESCGYKVESRLEMLKPHGWDVAKELCIVVSYTK